MTTRHDRHHAIIRKALYRYVAKLRAGGFPESTVTDLLVEFISVEILAEWERAGVRDKHLIAPFVAGPERAS